nr:PREDICTED: phospholipase A1-like [Bemisia tabaci]
MNASRDNCSWRRDVEDACPDPEINFSLYTVRDNGTPREDRVDLSSPMWLHSSGWDPGKDTVVLIHGYGGIQDHLPIGVLRDAYLTTRRYNTFVVDWGPLAAIPCYAAAVHNIKPAARCVAQLLGFLRNSGVPVRRTTCVGHSLGAHVCGVAANYINFFMHRIVGLDPARPLIRNNLKNRLDPGDAEIVQVIHTTATYGDPRRLGTIDFCVNGGRLQPFCAESSNQALCSHARSVCYMAESLDVRTAKWGVPCARRCLSDVTGRKRPSWMRRAAGPLSVPLGQHTPDSVSGTYCVNDAEAPYCQREPGGRGSPHCCQPYQPEPAFPLDTAASDQPRH